jgi:hypothetical protein
MTGTQLYLAIGVPVMVNLTALGVVATLLLHHFDKRFEDARELWRAELGRVEGVFDARLSHIEDKLGIR